MFYKLFSQENTPYFVVVFGVIIILMCLILFIKQFFFERKITTKTIRIITRIETDAVTNDECVKMTISNMGFHSVELKGFGFKHKNRDYDYLRTYKAERNIPGYQKIVISPRDSLETVIDLNDLKAKLNTKKVGKFKAYVIDVYGNYILLPAKDVVKFVELYFAKVEYIEKVRKMPVEKQEKALAKEKMYEERKKKILNHTIEDTFEKANIDGKEHKEEEPIVYDATNYAEPVKIIEKEQVAEEPVEEVQGNLEQEKFYEPEDEMNEPGENDESGFVFNFDDSFANSLADEDSDEDDKK